MSKKKQQPDERKPMKRPLEMGVAWTSGTWDLVTIGVPLETKDEDVEEMGREVVKEMFEGANEPAIAGIWLYHDPPVETWWVYKKLLDEREEEDDGQDES